MFEAWGGSCSCPQGSVVFLNRCFTAQHPDESSGAPGGRGRSGSTGLEHRVPERLHRGSPHQHKISVLISSARKEGEERKRVRGVVWCGSTHLHGLSASLHQSGWILRQNPTTVGKATEAGLPFILLEHLVPSIMKYSVNKMEGAYGIVSVFIDQVFPLSLFSPFFPMSLSPRLSVIVKWIRTLMQRCSPRETRGWWCWGEWIASSLHFNGCLPTSPPPQKNFL